jgi:hypothetical protein
VRIWHALLFTAALLCDIAIHAGGRDLAINALIAWRGLVDEDDADPDRGHLVIVHPAGGLSGCIDTPSAAITRAASTTVWP